MFISWWLRFWMRIEYVCSMLARKPSKSHSVIHYIRDITNKKLEYWLIKNRERIRLFIELQRKTGVLLFPIMNMRLYKRICVRVYPAYEYVYRYTPDNQPNWWNRAVYLTGYPPSASVRMLFFHGKKKIWCYISALSRNSPR